MQRLSFSIQGEGGYLLVPMNPSAAAILWMMFGFRLKPRLPIRQPACNLLIYPIARSPKPTLGWSTNRDGWFWWLKPLLSFRGVNFIDSGHNFLPQLESDLTHQNCCYRQLGELMMEAKPVFDKHGNSTLTHAFLNGSPWLNFAAAVNNP
jgi:hypothetical protein